MSDNIGKGSIVVYIERFVLAGFGVVVTALLTRTLTTDEYGLYQLVSSLLTFSMYIASFGLETTLSRYIPSFLAKDSYKLINKLLCWALLIRGGAIVFLFLIISIFREEFGNLLNAEQIFGSLYIVVVPYLGLSLINGIGWGLLVGYSQRHILGYIRMLSMLVMVSLVAYLALTNQGVFFAILILLVGATVEFSIYVWYSIKRFIENNRKGNDDLAAEFPIRRISSFSFYNWLFKGGQVFREYSVDQFVIAYFLNTTQVAFYAAAIGMPSIIRSFSPGRMLQGVILPKLVMNFEIKGTIESVLPSYCLLQKINIVLLLPLIIGCWVFVPEVINIIYGEKYMPAINASRILIAMSLFQGMSEPLYVISQSIEKANLVFYSSFFGLFNLAANFILIPIYGIEGAAIATGGTGVLILAFFILVFRFSYKVQFPLMIKTICIIIINLIPSLGLLVVAKLNGLFTLIGILSVILGIGSFLVLMYYNSIFSQKEWTLIKNKILNKL